MTLTGKSWAGMGTKAGMSLMDLLACNACRVPKM